LKHTWPVACSCGEKVTLKAVGTQRFASTYCHKCGNTIVPVGDEFVHKRLFNRGYAELQAGDYTLAIVFGAMSVESYVAFLYFKWRRIDIMPTTMEPSQADEDSWSEQLRTWGNVPARFDKVCDFLTHETFDSFIKNDGAVAASVALRHPTSTASSSLEQFFQDVLYSKRNKIVHHGIIDYGQQEGTECIEVSRTLLEIFDAMDRKRFAALMASIK